MISLPWRSKARALFKTSKAVSVPSRDMRVASRNWYWVVGSIAAKLGIINPRAEMSRLCDCQADEGSRQHPCHTQL
jgi:hypothetical protein